jgi:hypothetical protein
VAPPEVYKAACENDLNKPLTYQVLPSDTCPEDIVKEIEDSISRIVNLMVEREEITQKVADFILMKEKEFKLGRYYANWKCHKFKPPVYSFAEAAVRGIISCVGTASERACDFLDYLLNPGMREARSYLRDSKEMLLFIEKLKEQYPILPQEFAWLLIDYSAMYPSMPHNLAGAACREFLDSRTTQKPSTDLSMELLEVAQTKNYFKFGTDLIVQKSGAAIGQKMAPPYCCLGAAKLEEDHIYPDAKFKDFILNDISSNDEKDRFWRRFIDDIIAMTTMTESQAQEFVDWI